MEVWTFIHKETHEVIRFNVIRTDDDCFCVEYFFSDYNGFPPWFVFSKEEAKKAYKEFVHPQYSISYERPSTNKININDYKICSFILNE